jgi:hypothetical protein
LDALAILKIQVHHDRGKELADNGRFTLATNIEACLCDPQGPRQRGSKVTFEEGPVLAKRTVLRTPSDKQRIELFNSTKAGTGSVGKE